VPGKRGRTLVLTSGHAIGRAREPIRRR
jgi:hypothetical protein